MIEADSGGGRPPRSAVVDLGSNSVRLVVFEGLSRNPTTVFNEKAVLRLGRGMQASGRLDEGAVAQALTVLQRYHAIARAMRVVTFEVLATAAVRDAANGPAFVATLQARLPDVPIHVLSGTEEAALSAEGVLCGIPRAEGILADIGGGSLELVRLAGGAVGRAVTLKLGVIRLAERAGDDSLRARGIVEAELAELPWLAEATGGDLYLVGGAWRALARIHMAQTAYPLSLVHHYTIWREEARDLAGVVAAAGRRALERLPGVARRRIDDLPYAAVVLRRLLRATGASRVVFSASGLREGWYVRRIPAAARAQDPLLAAAQDLGRRLARDARLPAALFDWTSALFPRESEAAARLRIAACWLSDCGSQDHPERRAEQAFQRILWQPAIGLDHHARAFLALAIAMRYEAEPDAAFLHPARMLLDVAAAARAEVLGLAFRLAYTLSAGTAALLGATALALSSPGLSGQLVLRLESGTGVFDGDGISRRLDRLAEVLGLESATEIVAEAAAPR
jgi:exopolyphosphatase/guanosine-5'-triphosphate,3'-diphosphate pyrophosphatase